MDKTLKKLQLTPRLSFRLNLRQLSFGYRHGMISMPYVHDRAMVDAATALIMDHGAEAGAEADKRAKASRNAGNVVKFCRWRQVERLIFALEDGDGHRIVH
jgi:hypothetical protein